MTAQVLHISVPLVVAFHLFRVIIGRPFGSQRLRSAA